MSTTSVTTSSGTSRPHGDRGDVVVGWLVKLVAFLGVLGVLGFDALSIGSTAVTLEDQAVAAARAGQDAWNQTPSAQAAYDGALASATASNATNEVDPARVLVTADGTVTVTVTRTAATLVLHHVPPLRDWADRSATATAAPIR